MARNLIIDQIHSQDTNNYPLPAGKHPFPAGKLPMRSCLVIGSAVTTNIRRMKCYLESRIKLEKEQIMSQKEQECSQEKLSVSFFVFLQAIFCGLVTPMTHHQLEFNY